MNRRPLVVVGGPSGVGKSTVGRRLADTLGVAFLDADDLHSQAATACMRRGIALDDAARAPWLKRVGTWLQQQGDRGGVIACSALARRYRDGLRVYAPRAHIILLIADTERLRARIDARGEHYMPASLLADQLATYEPPVCDEAATEISAGDGVDAAVQRALAVLAVTIAVGGPPRRESVFRPAGSRRSAVPGLRGSS